MSHSNYDELIRRHFITEINTEIKTQVVVYFRKIKKVVDQGKEGVPLNL